LHLRLILYLCIYFFILLGVQVQRIGSALRAQVTIRSIEIMIVFLVKKKAQ
jgi:hypothetical protein